MFCLPKAPLTHVYIDHVARCVTYNHILDRAFGLLFEYRSLHACYTNVHHRTGHNVRGNQMLKIPFTDLFFAKIAGCLNAFV